jgi:hypothetical protein
MTSLFLSYARGDDEPFVERLYHALRAGGFDVWWDRACMPNRGATFTDEIRRAIAARDRLVLVVGPRAVGSAYVRDEWTCALDLDKPVHPIVRLGDVTQLPERVALYDARLMQRDADFERELAKLVEQLHAAPPPLGALHGVPSLPPHYLERPEALRRLRDAVTAALERRIAVTGAALRVGVQGMGGLGKSVLAAALARDTRVRFLFPGGVFWVPLGQEPRLLDLQRDLARALGDAGDFDTLPAGKERLRELLRERQALLVLDDLWHKAHAEAFDVLGPMGRVVITTRDTQLVTTFDGLPYEVRLLTDDEARRLLARWAGVEPDRLPAEATGVVGQCGRLPLALSICGAMVRDRKPWADVVADLREAELEYVSHDLPDYPHKDVWKAIKVGVDALACPEHGGRPEYPRRFAELSVFPPDEAVPEGAVSVLWSQTGGLKEVRARDLLRLLASKALAQLDADARQGSEAPRRVSLHPLVFAFATKTAGEPGRLHEQLLEAYRKRCPGGWPDGPNDGYFLGHLRRHLIAAGRAGELADLLHELRWLEVKAEAGLVFDLIGDFTAAAGLAEGAVGRRLELLEEALRRWSNFLSRHPQSLFQSLWNLCWWYDAPVNAGSFTPGAEEMQDAPNLWRLLERWRAEKQAREPGYVWLRSLRPPTARLGEGQQATLEGHKSDVQAMVFLPGSRTLVSVSEGEYAENSRGRTEEGPVRFWDVRTGQLRFERRGHKGKLRALASSPDGRRVATGGRMATSVCGTSRPGTCSAGWRRDTVVGGNGL